MATSPGIYNDQTVHQPTWLSRNWKWAVPLGAFVLLLLFAGFVASIFLLVESSFQHSGCYKEGLQRARNSSQVSEKIGLPITPGWFATGKMSDSVSSGYAELWIPISGSKRKGTLYILADKRSGKWMFKRVEIEVEGEDPRIELLRPEEKVLADN